jgi:polyisoprenyl-phosphate glycosyltransferase
MGHKRSRATIPAARLRERSVTSAAEEMAEDRPQLSWVVPMYRTREFVEPLCERAIGAAQALGLSCELVLVDDACPQGAADVAERLEFGLPLRVLRLSQNQGQDSAIRAGLRACTGKWALIIDGDLQDPPEGLSVLWPRAMQGYDAVFADRFGKYQSRGRLLSSRLYRRCLERLGDLPRGAGLFVLLNRRLIEAVAATRARRISILAAIAGARGHYTSVPIERAPRASGRSSYSAGRRWWKGAWSLWQIFAVRRLSRRL